MKYNIDYEILSYPKYIKRLNKILNNPDNAYPVEKLENLGYTSCGFPIEHYKIGKGPIHVTYMGGAHGNEIIGVDFVTQLIQNLSLGKGSFRNFNQAIYTIDFIPCQNPEGYFTTTYALEQLMGNMTPQEMESFSKKYWSYYREDDIKVNKVNKILNSFVTEFSNAGTKEDITNFFWQKYLNKNITLDSMKEFLSNYYFVNKNKLDELVDVEWQNNFGEVKEVDNTRYHTQIFNGVNLDLFPEYDEAHINLKTKLKAMYKDGLFPMGTLANFFANSDGINLNDNNPYFYEITKERIAKYGNVYAKLRDNHILKSVNGPIGLPNISMEEDFRYCPENEAILKYVQSQEQEHQYAALFNCHGTGGMLYTYPVDDDSKVKNFNFYINNRIATEYSRKTGNVYEELTGTNNAYKVMGHPDKVTGFGDVLRSKYAASFILELSKMGGNPIAPYGDYKGNYVPTMVANFEAMMVTLKTILELRNLYDLNYTVNYNDDGYANYEVISKNTRR